MEDIILQPQEGPQEQFLSTPADIAIYGGAAGAGKSFALLMEPTRHVDNRKFGAVCFRRESPQITSEGGLWDTSYDVYGGYQATPLQSPKYHWKFKTGATITFSHLQYEKNLKAWDGSQIPLLMFDELQHFTEKMFFYMLSRNRTTCGIKPYVRGTCNPDPDSWLCEFLIKAGFVNGETGYPIYEMSGKLRYFVRESGEITWYDTKKEALKDNPKARPKSFTFIPGKLSDNPALTSIDPDYEANLDALLDYEKKRLKDGNWFARPTAGELFKRSYFNIVDYEVLEDLVVLNACRYWDRAATLPSDKNKDPDYTACVLMYLCEDENYYIVDVHRDRLEPGDVQDLLFSITNQDDDFIVVGLEQEPGASGKIEVYTYEKEIQNKQVETFPKTKDKLTCWKPLARAAKQGKIYMVRAPWNKMFFWEAEAVTDGTQEGHDDMIDCAAGAYSFLEGDNQSAFYKVKVT